MMKKLCLIFLVCLLLAGCMAEEPAVDAPSFQATEPSTAVPETTDGLCISYADIWEPIPYEVQYIRTNGGHDAARQYPLVVSVGSKAELEAYYEANRETYDLERKEQVYADTTIGFLGYHAQCLCLGLYALLRGYILQVIGYIGYGDALEVVYLTA